MKTFRVYSTDQNLQKLQPVLINDSFSFLAMVFNFFWFLYHGLWIETGIFLFGQIALSFANAIIGYKLYLALQITLYIAIGVFASQIRIQKLERNGYKFKDIIVARNEEKARLKFYKNYLGK